jgi:L,D-transpeptidase ErfK/SrfK
MTSGTCRSSVARKVIIIGSLVGYGALVWALVAHAATAGSTSADVRPSAQAPGSSVGTAPQRADAPFSPSDAPSAGPAPRPSEAPSAEAYRFSVDPKLNDGVVGEVQITRTTPQDSLADIARRFSVGYNEIQRANPGVDMWVPGAGRRVVVPTQFVLPEAPHVGIVVNIAEMRLYYFPPRSEQGKEIVYTYPLGIGRVNWKTPSGVTTVVRKVVNPAWRPPADILEEHREEGDPLPAEIRPGPDDPMGTRALYLGWPEYAIHGTNKPVGVGMRVSHGCMHLYPEDILQLYNLVPLGTEVRVVNQPFVFGWHRGDLYMQAFGPLAGDQRNWQNTTRELLEQAMGPDIRKQLQERNEQVRWDLLLQLARDPQGIPVAITDSNASLQQVLENAREVANRAPEGALSTDM